ncbi:hypothetical protein EDC04DRAFT_79275 [Pisolithus marmoratus]|nr:hypothetical protein EDC04DRAFT_79275 [Pisolithus marmoratus]
MHAEHVHCHPVALGFIESEWSHGSWFASLLSLSTCLLCSPCIINQVPDIQESLYHLRMPTLSHSMKYSMQYTAEHGIGAILILEYLYFLLHVKDPRNDLQVALDLSVDEYQSSGTRESVCKLINGAFKEHGENVEILCPILLQIAKEKQMSKTMNRKG